MLMSRRPTRRGMGERGWVGTEGGVPVCRGGGSRGGGLGAGWGILRVYPFRPIAPVLSSRPHSHGHLHLSLRTRQGATLRRAYPSTHNKPPMLVCVC